ncbi:hypothetical protein ACSFA8_20010 [Variovorax sp. RT4R15]|uniref:hypothetical protein n=1 Tax=Variovorax sp. RT4R15 TaxID=3443737 RepID=UPI003F47FE8E
METAARHHYEARFCSLFNEDHAMAFPCDAHGKVNLDELSDRARNNYFYARILIGREFVAPVVLARRESSASQI